MRKKLFTVLSLIAAMLIFTVPTQAASQDECAIWICLPGGFAFEGCNPAFKAMIKRIKKLKSPLPSFSSCADNSTQRNGSQMTFHHGFAAFVPAHSVCKKYADWTDDYGCVEWTEVPSQYIKGTRCYHGYGDDDYSNPPGCTKTYRWAEVFIEGELTGKTYYWD